MPVISKKQWKWLVIHEPKILKRWLKEYPVKFKSLPKKAKKRKK